jgi:hypothetical protein
MLLNKSKQQQADIFLEEGTRKVERGQIRRQNYSTLSKCFEKSPEVCLKLKSLAKGTCYLNMPGAQLKKLIIGSRDRLYISFGMRNVYNTDFSYC